VHAVLLRDGGGDLTFKVEMLLPANLEFAFDDGMGLGYRGHVATRPQDRPLFKARVGGERRFHSQEGGQVGVGDRGKTGCFAGLQMGLCHHKEDRLPHIMHGAGGEEGLVMHGRRGVRHVGKIGSGEDSYDAGCGAHWGQVDRCNLGMGAGRQTEGEVQGTCRQGHVIDIARLTGDMQGGAIVREGEA
jgi:hypothetical protein